MLPVANRALVRRAADGLAAAGVGRIVVVCTAAASGPVRRALEGGLTATDVQVVEVPRDTGPLGAVLAARELLPTGPVVLHAGDALVLGDLRTPLARLGEEGLDALVVAVPGRAGATTRDRRGTVALQPRPQPAGVQVVGPLALTAAETLEAERGAAATLDDLPDAVRRAGGRVEEVVLPRAWRFSG